MKKEQYQKIIWKMIAIVASIVAFLLYPLGTFATDNTTELIQEVRDDVISISMPVVSESDTSVFDFILDPQELLYSTDAVRYGGGAVEKGAALLFHNKEGEHDFSGYSDWLEVTNQSTVPVKVTVTAHMTGFEEIRLVEDENFSENTDPAIYLAIVDSRGNVQSLSADGQASISLELDMDYDTYSFGLTGACNVNAQWQDISVCPTIKVTWYVEPIMPEEEDILTEEDITIEEDASIDEDIEENISVEDDIISDKDDFSEDSEEIIGDDLQDDNNAPIDNANEDDEESGGNNSEEQENTVIEDSDEENNNIDLNDIPDYNNRQNMDNDYENFQDETIETTNEE